MMSVATDIERGAMDVLSAKETAQALGYHKDHIYRLLNDGTIKGRRVSGVWLISRREVERVKRLKERDGKLYKGQG